MRTQGGIDLNIAIDRALDTPLYQQVYVAIRQGIGTGTIHEGQRLPSTRRLAEQLGTSRPTIERAYQQLVIEGYIDDIERSGFVVRHIDTDFLTKTTENSADNSTYLSDMSIPVNRIDFFEEYKTDKAIKYNFSFTQLPAGSFPKKAWLKAENDILYGPNDGMLLAYPNELTPNNLQRELCQYLRRARGVACVPQQVLIFPSTEFAIETIVQLFDHSKDTLGIEEPGFATFYQVARRLGFHVEGIASDKGGQRLLSDARSKSPHVLYITPSHQFPTGRVMTLDYRVELLKWARSTGAYLIEDDACWEYRFDVDPIPSLQSLDTGHRVIYLGSFSKVLSPSLRVAYAVLPIELLNRYFKVFPTSSTGVSLLTQEILAQLIANGEYERHVRKIVARTRASHDTLLASLVHEFGYKISLSGIHAGLHLFATINNVAGNQSELIDRAANKGVKIYPSSLYWFEEPAPLNQVLIGFSSIDPERIPDGVHALYQAWFAGT